MSMDSEKTIEEIEAFLGDPIEKVFEKTSGFFGSHFKSHSQSRRQAPIYWPLQTPSGSYTLWVYYPRFDRQVLFTCVNDFIEPKLKTINEDCSTLRNINSRDSDKEKQLEKLINLKLEIETFRDDLLRISTFWQANSNDGVIINAAPFWRLFQHKPWQKKLKETWGKMEDGDYDWAHLAYAIWPERVLKKCHQDRSLAIAHNVEDELWIGSEAKPLSNAQLSDYVQKKISVKNQFLGGSI